MKYGMLRYLKELMDDYAKWREEGKNLDRYEEILHDKLIAMLACKGMAEVLIGEPVNLQKDGKVTVGF